MHTTTASAEAERRAKQERDFNWFLEKAETKMLLALVPSLEPPELLRTLLRGAFEAGISSGAGHVIGELLHAMLKSSKDREE